MQIIDTITAVDDSGVLHTIYVWEDRIPVSDPGGATSYISGMRRLRTSRGKAVRQIDDKTFEVVSTKMIIRKL